MGGIDENKNRRSFFVDHMNLNKENTILFYFFNESSATSSGTGGVT